MSISTYAELKTEVEDWSYRSDLTARIPNFIALCESDMQVRCKLVEFEALETVTITAGVGDLPTGFTGMRSIYWDGDLARPLRYITPDQMEAKRNDSGNANWYTITGTNILTSSAGDGSVVMRYKARFIPLSDTATTNVLLTNYPDAYLHGTLLQLNTFTKNRTGITDSAALYEAAVQRIVIDNNQKKYAGVSLEVRPR